MLFLKHFRHYYKKYAYAFILSVLILVTINWYQLEIPRILKLIIDGVKEETITSVSDISSHIIQLIIIIAGVTIGRFLWRYFLIGTSRKIEADIRQEMFKHALKLDQEFYSNEKTGGLMSYFTNDLQTVRELYGFGLLMLIDGIVMTIFVLIRMFGLEPKMTLFAFIPIALMGVLVFLLELRMEKKFKTRQEAFEKMSDFTQESFSGITIIKAYVQEVKEAVTFKNYSRDLNEKSLKHIHYVVLVNVLIDVLINLVIIAIIAFGSLLIAQGNLTGGELTEYISYFFSLLWPVFAISGFLNINGQGQASAKRIFAFLETKPRVYEKENTLTDVTFDGSITFTNLSFKYPDGNDLVLKDVTFHVSPGEFIGILGRTGSGKSTLVELVLHVYNSDNGMISFNGHDLNEVSLKALRHNIAYVPQDNFLFSSTIKDNIGFAFDALDEEQVKTAARLADVDENINEFKEGYNTVLGERGVTVSGGQKQRISIARALAKDAPILILDDSVSAVDTKTEEAIIKNLKNVRKGKTTLVIAHRITTVKKLDKIALFDKGRLVGFGTHKELLKTNTLYQEMVKRQELDALVEGGA